MFRQVPKYEGAARRYRDERRAVAQLEYDYLYTQYINFTNKDADLLKKLGKFALKTFVPAFSSSVCFLRCAERGPPVLKTAVTQIELLTTDLLRDNTKAYNNGKDIAKLLEKVAFYGKRQSKKNKLRLEQVCTARRCVESHMGSLLSALCALQAQKQLTSKQEENYTLTSQTQNKFQNVTDQVERMTTTAAEIVKDLKEDPDVMNKLLKKISESSKRLRRFARGSMLTKDLMSFRYCAAVLTRVWEAVRVTHVVRCAARRVARRTRIAARCARLACSGSSTWRAKSRRRRSSTRRRSAM